MSIDEPDEWFDTIFDFVFCDSFFFVGPVEGFVAIERPICGGWVSFSVMALESRFSTYFIVSPDATFVFVIDGDEDFVYFVAYFGG